MVGAQLPMGRGTLPNQKDVKEVAHRILKTTSQPVVRYRLLRDILSGSYEDSILQRARASAMQSPWVSELAESQKDDGSWGRFHSMDTRVKDAGRNWTTETAIERGVALGLDRNCEIFRNAVEYLNSVLLGSAIWPDPLERNDRWTTGVRLITAATLAQIDPDNSALDDVWRLWFRIAERTFASSRYDSDEEVASHETFTGISVRGTYLEMHNRYSLILLASRSEDLPENLQRSILKWIWGSKKGIGYLEVPLHDPAPDRSAGKLERWIRSSEIVSGFRGCGEYAKGALEWLWRHRNRNGLWDFGARARSSFYYPLSDSWRSGINRRTDYSTRILALITRMNDSKMRIQR